MAKVLLINPSYSPSYGGTKVSIVNPIYPTLGLATIAATALERGHKVEILDMSWRSYDFELIRNLILKIKPDIVGITATTPLMNLNHSGIKSSTSSVTNTDLTYNFILLRFLPVGSNKSNGARFGINNTHLNCICPSTPKCLTDNAFSQSPDRFL